MLAPLFFLKHDIISIALPNGGTDQIVPILVTKYVGTALCLTALLGACSPAPIGGSINDPYEATNRAIHGFNKQLDMSILRPAGQVAAAIPVEYTSRVSNFADNVGLPGMVANGLLQGDIGGASTNTMRFLLNTTVGIGGLFDPAGAIGLTEDSTDFGETLAVWGVPEGAYLELPILGPSTERDAAGEIVDIVLDPLGLVGLSMLDEYGTASRIVDIAITRGAFLQTIDSVLYDSADSYAQARLAYLQNRRFELGDDTPVDSEIDPFLDDFSLEGFE